MKKLEKGKLFSMEISGRHNILSGLIIDYNKNWVLIKNNTVDYIIDGYVVFRKENIEKLSRGKKEKFIEKVISLKNYKNEKDSKIQFENFDILINYLNDDFKLFSIEGIDENKCYIGNLYSITDKKIIINCLDTKGKWGGKKSFKSEDIMIIEFDTDYIRSLQLVSEQKM